MIQTVALVIGAASLVTALYDIASKKYDDWKTMNTSRT
jgi:nitrogen fixation-related uncharacterized protein